MNSFVEFLAEYRGHLEKAKVETARKLRQKAPNFNIFRTLDMQDEMSRYLRSEMAHSAFLAGLLDSSGSHGQGPLFIDSFLKMCQDKKVFPDHVFSPGSIIEENWQVITEYSIPVDSGYRRLDIVIYSYGLGRFYVIENKINDDVNPIDVAKQLRCYSQWLDKQTRQFSEKALILITPNGINVCEPKHISLSYRTDIKRWLEQCLEDVQPDAVRVALKDYIKILDPNVEADDAMLQQDKELEKLLTDNEQYVSMVKRFWSGLKSNLDKRVMQNRLADGWELVPVHLNLDNPLHDYAQCHIQPKGQEGRSQAPFLRVGIEQGRLDSSYPLYYGFHWSRPEMPEMLETVGPPTEISKWGKLDDELGWWLRKQQTGYKVGSEEFAQQMTDHPGKFINEMAGCVWSLFKEHYEWLEKANHELSRRYGGS